MLNVKLNKKKDYFIYSMFIPGLGQMKMGNYEHGVMNMVGFFSYLFIYHYITEEPTWFYRDKIFSSKAISPKSPYRIYQINGNTVDFNVYNREHAKKLNEDKKVQEYENRKKAFQLFGLILYTINLIDTGYLIHLDDMPQLDYSFMNNNNYFGLKYKLGF